MDAIHALVKSLSSGTTDAIWELRQELGKVSEKPADILEKQVSNLDLEA